MRLRIKEARERVGLTQKELAEILGIKKTTFNGYETGAHDPKSDLLSKIALQCDTTVDFLLSLTDDPHRKLCQHEITGDEQLHINNYRALDDHGRKAVNATMMVELERMDELRKQAKQENDNKILKLTPHKIPKYEFRASAGTGQFLDSSPYEMVELGEDEPQDASFLVTITGDSMEPTYYNGDTLYIKQQPEVGIGEVGLFAIDGQVFVKEMAANGLKSRNPKYKMIKFRDGNYVHCYGKVIGIKESNVPRPMMTVAAFDGEIKGAHTMRSPVTEKEFRRLLKEYNKNTGSIKRHD